MVPRVARIRPRKPARTSFGNSPRVVDMRMGQQHGVDVGGPEREGAVVQCLQGLLALEQAAVDQQPPGRGLRRGSRSPSPCGPRRKIERSRSWIVSGQRRRRSRCAAPRPEYRRAGSRWWDAARWRSSGSNGCRRWRTPWPCSGGNSAWVMTASMVVAPAAASALAAAIKVPPRRDDVVDQQRPAGRRTDGGCGESDVDGAIAVADLVSRPHGRARAGRRDRCTQGRDSASGPTTIVAGSILLRAARPRSAGMADRFSASMPGNTALMSRVR